MACANVYHSIFSGLIYSCFAFPRGASPHAKYKTIVFEPFHFRGRRGLGSEAIRHTRGRGQRAMRHRNRRRARQTGVAEVDCCIRPIRHGLRSYGRGLLLSLGTLTLRGTTCVDANGESPGGMNADRLTFSERMVPEVCCIALSVVALLITMLGAGEPICLSNRESVG